jgi:hypothetical protein
MQRFISFNAELIASVQEEYKFNELEIKDAKSSDYRSELEFLYLNRLWLSSRYKKLSAIQAKCKAVRAGKEQITASLLQQMEQVATSLVKTNHSLSVFQSNEAYKDRLARLNVLQWVIRKHKASM